VGLTVFDLGPLRGAATLPDDARRVAGFCGAPERAEPWIRTWQRRAQAIARHLSEEQRRRGMYLALYAGRLFGGTRGSSFHDVLMYAGLRDVAARAYEGWPQYADEQVLALDPDVIVTRRGMARALCGRPAMAALRACRDGDVIEIDGAILDQPGPGILEAAEAVHAAVYE
jgi:iron complex transport system substrate-binding protein